MPISYYGDGSIYNDGSIYSSDEETSHVSFNWTGDDLIGDWSIVVRFYASSEMGIGTDDYLIYLNEATNFRGIRYDNNEIEAVCYFGGTPVYLNEPISTNTWYQVAVTYSILTGWFKLYVNDTLVDSVQNTGALSAVTGTCYLLGNGESDGDWEGYGDDWIVHSAELSSGISLSYTIKCLMWEQLQLGIYQCKKR